MAAKLIHQSMKATASEAQTHAMLDFHASKGAEFITLTEAGLPQMREALREWASDNEWHIWHPEGAGHAGNAILSKRRPDRGRSFRLTRLLLRTKRSVPITLAAAHYPGWGWISVWHAPAHTEGLRSGLWTTKVYLSALVGLRAARLRMRGPVTIAADWNLDLRQRRWRSLLGASFPGMRWGWHMGQKGTFGARVIDGHLTNKPIRERAQTLRDLDGFDHNGVLLVVKA